MNDFKEFRKMAERYRNMANDSEQFVADFLGIIGNIALRKVEGYTPVGQYHNSKTGNPMRDSWKLGPIKRSGDKFEVLMHNTQGYSGYVDEGHVVVNKAGEELYWWEGYHMTEVSIMEVEAELPAAFKEEWQRFLAQHGG